MAAKEVERTIEIDDNPEKCYKVICDFESYPEWSSAIRSVHVINQDKKGRPKHVEFKISVMGRDVRYVLDYKYDDKNLALSWSFVEGDIRNIVGSYNFKKAGSKKTLATQKLLVDFGFWVPGPILNTLTNVSLRSSMKEFKDRVEGKR